MARYLVEVPHEAEVVACLRAIQIFLQTGSHFLTHADWGCLSGEHKAWIIMEGENETEARLILPPSFRHQAKVTLLSKFNLEQIDQALRQHESSAGQNCVGWIPAA